MSDYNTDLTLKVETTVDIDIEVSDHGICYLVALIYVGNEEEPHEARVELSGIVESIKDDYVDVGDYTELYIIAHELTRQGEKLREVARNMEDSVSAVEDLFDLN
tara:strand:- start:1161 stop:1475 length:315 start_codon:yes stop_codon:yes gene_type:complete